MRDVDATNQEPTQPRPWRTLFWIAVAGLIFGILGLGEIGEDVLRSGRNSLHWHKASGDIVVVKIDNDSLKQVGRWPWPRHVYTPLLDRLNKAGAKRVFFDIQFYGPTAKVEDDALAQALERSGNVVLALGRAAGPNGVEAVGPSVRPLAKFAKHAKLGAILTSYNYQNSITRIPYAVSAEGEVVPSFSALLSGRFGRVGDSFRPDYSLDPHSIPTIPAKNVLRGDFDPKLVTGKDVVIGAHSDVIGDLSFVPGTGLIAGALVHVIGAETLKQGYPLDAGWLPLYLASLVLAALLLLGWLRHHQGFILTAAFVAVLLGPAALETRLIYVDVTPALLVLGVCAGVLLRRRFKKRGLVDPVSGLPNLAALKEARGARDKALIVARILNYAEIVAALPTTSERQLVEQTVARLTVGDRGRTLFQGDDGIFAWFDDPAKPFGHHLEALHALFRTPVRVGGMAIDLSVSFGVEIGSARSVANRLGSALLAAEQAGHDGLKWKYHDPDSLQDASWKLSMLSQLDEAVDRGEVWVAYQPKVDLKTRKIIGAEALARWTHPEKGPIAAAEFVAAAEQNDRIGKLTAFVLDRAIAAAAALNKPGTEFDMSVNLSGRLLGDKALVGRIAILLERHGLAAKNLTLELTETAAIAGSGEALDLLTQLRELGVNISIDDYGTGLSTLEYLKRVPAGEIKIDQSFIKGMMDNRSERLMVSSTIALAHSLGRRIVAEGVETREALELLAEMECDIAQGFITGRPMSLESLRRRLMTERRAKVA
jgi:EAL domain-containing protein (putative c-di-GMP-specific phosphodiesterase class I)/CHASE2 domain-containing sensor protein